jgi:hypothetical protein
MTSLPSWKKRVSVESLLHSVFFISARRCNISYIKVITFRKLSGPSDSENRNGQYSQQLWVANDYGKHSRGEDGGDPGGE